LLCLNSIAELCSILFTNESETGLNLLFLGKKAPDRFYEMEFGSNKMKKTYNYFNIVELFRQFIHLKYADL